MRAARRTLAAVLVAGSLTLSGCGIEERIVHLQPAPTENSQAGAPLRVEAAEQIAARVLAQAAAATTEEERAAVTVGPALRVANARAARTAPTAPTADVVTPQAPTVLAMSRGTAWPRAILAATLDEATQTQYLHVLVSGGPTEQFVLYATASMLPGATVPGLGELGEGTSFAASSGEEPIEGSVVVEEYANGLAFPDPAETSVVTVDDTYAESLRSNAAKQAEAFGDLATLSVTHAALPDSLVAFGTADGGRLIFAQMTRTSAITLGEDAKELKIEDEALQTVSGTSVVTESFTVEHLENVVFVAPAEGLAGLIGAEEVLLRAEGS